MLLLESSATLKMGIRILQKLSILCHEEAVGNSNKLKRILKKRESIMMTAKLFQS